MTFNTGLNAGRLNNWLETLSAESQSTEKSKSPIANTREETRKNSPPTSAFLSDVFSRPTIFTIAVSRPSFEKTTPTVATASAIKNAPVPAAPRMRPAKMLNVSAANAAKTRTISPMVERRTDIKSLAHK